MSKPVKIVSWIAIGLLVMGILGHTKTRKEEESRNPCKPNDCIVLIVGN